MLHALAAVGLIASEDEAKVAEGALIKMFREVLVAKGQDSTFVNDGVTSNLKEAERTGREGRNEYKAASQALMATFTLYMPSRSVGLATANALWAAFCASKGLEHGTRAALEGKARARQARAEARAQHHLDVLAWIDRTPSIRKLMPRGSMDGYRAALEAGTLADAKLVSPKPSLNRRERRLKSWHRNRHFDDQVLRKAMAASAGEATAQERA